jgi:hypothetical protein
MAGIAGSAIVSATLANVCNRHKRFGHRRSWYEGSMRKLLIAAALATVFLTSAPARAEGDIVLGAVVGGLVGSVYANGLNATAMVVGTAAANTVNAIGAAAPAVASGVAGAITAASTPVLVGIVVGGVLGYIFL